MAVGEFPTDDLLLDPELGFEKESAEAIYDRIVGDLRLTRRARYAARARSTLSATARRIGGAAPAPTWTLSIVAPWPTGWTYTPPRARAACCPATSSKRPSPRRLSVRCRFQAAGVAQCILLPTKRTFPRLEKSHTSPF